jgi:hypothetical protein
MYEGTDFLLGGGGSVLQDIVDEAGALQEMAKILKSTKFSDNI